MTTAIDYRHYTNQAIFSNKKRKHSFESLTALAITKSGQKCLKGGGDDDIIIEDTIGG